MNISRTFRGWHPIYKRELRSYFTTPLAYIFLIIFLLLQGIFTFYLGGFFERGQADLSSFFSFQPWLFIFLIPALSMRLWAEERRLGTIELLLTLPITAHGVIAGKYLATLTFIIFGLVLTLPMWLTVNYLGSPDNGLIFMGYIGSILLAASYLSIGMTISCMTRNQVVAFVLSIGVCFFFAVLGLPVALDLVDFFLGEKGSLVVANLSLLTHFNEVQRGVLTGPSIIYFLTLNIFWYWLCRLMLQRSREAG
ncbi:ABC transporter permease subunit [Temperatibacter marinus]|uniref:ABC transporter permease subunit n=1 Tax=Temperatibacter marinus TaxID=1456591 RepID=A0AA52EIS3_9PROT|nr:ABC transporter permease subunit [Temperatibacter marinus]WND03297.1 ABC transporter permease subunit [Temperatibacter marinus]